MVRRRRSGQRRAPRRDARAPGRLGAAQAHGQRDAGHRLGRDHAVARLGAAEVVAVARVGDVVARGAPPAAVVAEVRDVDADRDQSARRARRARPARTLAPTSKRSGTPIGTVMSTSPPGRRTRRSSSAAASDAVCGSCRELPSAPKCARSSPTCSSVDSESTRSYVSSRERQVAQVGVQVRHAEARERPVLGRQRDDVQVVHPRPQAAQDVQVVERRAGVEHHAGEPPAREPRELHDPLVEAPAVALGQVAAVADRRRSGRRRRAHG